MTKLLDGIPILPGNIVGSQVRVWCDFCRKYQFHGWPNPEENISHRVAHCFKDNSPYQRGGYYFEVNDRG